MSEHPDAADLDPACATARAFPANLKESAKKRQPPRLKKR